MKRFYTFQIPDYLAKSLRKMFDKHIDKEAKVTTDKWKGYKPIANDYDLTQILSDKGAYFKALRDDSSGEILDKNNLFLGKRKQY